MQWFTHVGIWFDGRVSNDNSSELRTEKLIVVEIKCSSTCHNLKLSILSCHLSNMLLTQN